MSNAALKREYEQLLKEQEEDMLIMERYRAANAIEFFTTPPNPGFNPKQAPMVEAFLDEYYRTFLLSGGNRMGKTCLLTLMGLSVLFGKFLWNNQSILHLFPHNKPRKVRYVGQGWHDHIQAVVIPEIKKWWPENRPVKTHGNGIITDTHWRDVKTGSTIEIMSNNQRSKEHEGWSGDFTLYDEPCRREIYIANARGLADRNGREMFACTLLDEPWIDRDIARKTNEDGTPDRRVFCIEGTSYDNVGFGISKEGVDNLADKLDEDEYNARIKGIPAYKIGLVYPDFKRNIHLKNWFQIPLDWMVDIAIDIHPRERQAVLFTATDPRNDRYICNEIWDYGDGKWVGEQIVREIKRHSYRVNRVIIDPLSKGDRNNDETVFNKVFNVLAAHGYLLETAVKDKTAGILEVNNHLKGPNKEPSIWLLDNCVRTLYEFEGYMWEMKDGKPTGKPMDKDDHFMENLYRTLLLNTQWFPVEEYEDTYDETEDTRDEDTGY